MRIVTREIRVSNRKLLYKMLLVAIPVLGLSVVSAQQVSNVFKPSTEPVFSTPRAKPNIHMVLDDSGSMKGNAAKDVTLNGKVVERRTALDYAYKALISKYKDKAYIGVSFLWQGNDANGLIRLPIGDYSKTTLDDINKKYSISNLISSSPGGTPINRGVYEALKMYRGLPLTIYRHQSDAWQAHLPILGTDNKYYYYQTTQLPSPVRYRCQQNHMIVMTDGEPSYDEVHGIDKNDKDIYDKANNQIAYKYNAPSRGQKYGTHNYTTRKIRMDGTVDTSAIATIGGEDLGRLSANIDLRKYQTGMDAAGKPWIDDIFSAPMPVYMHTVSLGVNPKSTVYTYLTGKINIANNKDKPGLNLGFEKDGSAESLLAAFDTIFATIIRSTSSASAVNDRTSSALVKNAPTFDAQGNVDVTTIGTIRYDTTYDFRSYIGSVRAKTSYLNTQTGKSEKVDLWTTDETIQPTQGRYVTLSSAKYPDKALATLNATNTGLTDTQVQWLTNFKVNPDEANLRARLYPLGSITSPDVVVANKDILNINISKNKMSKAFAGDLSNWWLYKAKFQPNNLIVTADNDGMISFIKAQRGLAKGSKAGERDTAYFPKMLVPRFNEIAQKNRVSTLVMEGRTNLVDAKVFQPTDTGGEHIYATIGLTSQGGGGKGLVGYRIYAAPENKVLSGQKLDDNDIYGKVTPLFEITNEGPEKLRSRDFSDLGYTYSGFEFFNYMHGNEARLVAVFGNGFGGDSKQSVLYFMNAYTGQKILSIVLDPNGMGAGTPSIIVRPNEAGGQELDRIYVGDYSGTLYKIDFNGKNFSAGTAKVTALFKAPQTNFGQSAISVKPLVVKARNSNLYRVFFGTGIAASYELDRHTNSEVQHSVYGITDYGKNGSTDTYSYGSAKATLKPVLTIADLKEGKIQYKNNQQLENKDYESFNDYDLDVTVPYADPNDKNPDKDGWYIKLTADGNASGERVIKDPQYDTQNDAVIFFTWGINERNYKKGVLDDPCLADFIYGKTLAFSAASGSFSDGLKGLSNKGKTGRAEGGLTGEWIDNAPNGNGSTSLSDLAKEMSKDKFKEKFDELVEAVGEGNSAISDDPSMRNGGSDVTVEGDTVIEFKTSDTSGGDGSSEDITVTPPKKPQGKKPIRLSIQTLFNS